MPYHEFRWTPKTIEHVADNDITPEDFEDVVRHPIEVAASFSTGRPCAKGYAGDGRKIICIYEHLDEVQILPVTAFSIERED